MTNYDLRRTFHCLRLSKLCFHVLIFVAVIKDHDQKQVREGSLYFFILHIIVCYQKISWQELKAGIHEAEAREEQWLPVTFSWFTLPDFFYITRTNSLGKALSTVSWAFPYQSWKYTSGWWGHSGSSLQNDFILC